MDDDIIPPTPHKRIKLSPPGTTIHTRCTTYQPNNIMICDDQCEFSTCECHAKYGKIIDKLIKIQEIITEERKLEMLNIHKWMEQMTQDRIKLTNCIQKMIDMLGKKFDSNTNSFLPHNGQKLTDSDCHFAGIYLVHN